MEYFYFYSNGSYELLSEDETIKRVFGLIEKEKIAGITYDTASLQGFSSASFAKWQIFSDATQIEKDVKKDELYKKLGATSKWSIDEKGITHYQRHKAEKSQQKFLYKTESALIFRQILEFADQ